jgi:hypothetical protein
MIIQMPFSKLELVPYSAAGVTFGGGEGLLSKFGIARYQKLQLIVYVVSGSPDIWFEYGVMPNDDSTAISIVQEVIGLPTGTSIIDLDASLFLVDTLSVYIGVAGGVIRYAALMMV